MRLTVFRCLSITAIKSIEKSKGKIANNENSGIEGEGVRVVIGVGESDGSGVGDDVGAGVIVGLGRSSYEVIDIDWLLV
jgi:hypothetical protein